MRIPFIIYAGLYASMACSLNSYADGIPQVPSDYPSHKVLGKCYSAQQLEQMQQQLSNYNITRVEVSAVLRSMAADYRLTGDTLKRVLGFAESFEQMERELPAPDPDSDEFRNFDFKLGLAFTALTLFLNTNDETATLFYHDRDNADSKLGRYLSELDTSREIYMTSLNTASHQADSDSRTCAH